MRESFGDKRLVTRYLLFPKELEGETRWLETADIIQEYKKNESDYWNGWRDVSRADTPTPCKRCGAPQEEACRQDGLAE